MPHNPFGARALDLVFLGIVVAAVLVAAQCVGRFFFEPAATWTP